MPIDWDTFQSTIDAEIEAAATATSTDLASKASSITRLTDEEIVELFPTPADAQMLKNLMEIVKSAEDENVKINRLVSNIEELGGAAIKIIGALT
jgi:hypothetical protein